MIPFSPPRLDKATVDAVAEVLLSGWITTGPKTKEFERQLTQYVGCKKTICLGSATAGMELMLRWFGVGPGDEVIVPAYTYCATANVVMHCGAKVVMVDINEDDFNVNLEAIRAAISDKTKVIMPVDIGGWPCDYQQLMAMVADDTIKKQFQPSNDEQKQLGRIMILSDAAHSIGAMYKGQRHGSAADAVVFSFHAVKNLTTAEGGAVCLNLPDTFDCDKVYQNLNIKSLHGQSKDALAKITGVGNWRYDVVEPGYKCNMMDIQAAIGLVELQRYDETLLRRKQIVEFYLKSFKEKKWAIVPSVKDETRESSYHLFLLRVDGASEGQRDTIIQKIFEKQVSVNVHFQPLPLLTAYKSIGYQMSDYPNAWSAYQNEISLPVYYSLTDENLNQIVSAVSESVEEVIN